MLDDSAAFARAALALFEATGEPRYLAAAEQETRARAGPLRRRGWRALSHRRRR